MHLESIRLAGINVRGETEWLTVKGTQWAVSSPNDELGEPVSKVGIRKTEYQTRGNSPENRPPNGKVPEPANNNLI